MAKSSTFDPLFHRESHRSLTELLQLSPSEFSQRTSLDFFENLARFGETCEATQVASLSPSPCVSIPEGEEMNACGRVSNFSPTLKLLLNLTLILSYSQCLSVRYCSTSSLNSTRLPFLFLFRSSDRFLLFLLRSQTTKSSTGRSTRSPASSRAGERREKLGLGLLVVFLRFLVVSSCLPFRTSRARLRGTKAAEPFIRTRT